MKKILVLAAIALSMSACMTVAPPLNSVLLGERTVDFKTDHDVITVATDEGSFNSLFFIVNKSDIEVFDLLVVYRNGDKEKFETRLVFKEGARSLPMELKGGQRRIESIQFTYKTVGTWQGGKAHMSVYGVR